MRYKALITFIVASLLSIFLIPSESWEIAPASVAPLFDQYRAAGVSEENLDAMARAYCKTNPNTFVTVILPRGYTHRHSIKNSLHSSK